MGLGWYLRRIGLLTEELVSGMNKLGFVVLFPIMLMQKIGAQQIGKVFNGPLMFGCLITYGSIWVISFIIVKFKKDIAPNRQGVIVQGAFRSNTAVIGLAILAGVYGESVFGPAGIVLSAVVPFMNVFSVLALILPHRSAKGKKSLAQMALIFATNPLIIGALLGAAKSAIGFSFPNAINGAFEMLADMAIPISLIGAGGSLKLEKIRVDLRASLIVSFLKLLLMPAMAWAILSMVFHVSGMMLTIGVIYSAAPTAIASFIMSEQLEGDADLAASILVLTHLISIFTMSAWLAALLRWA